MRELAVVVLLVGCAPSPAPTAPLGNEGGRPAVTIGASLGGPYHDLGEVAEAHYYPTDAAISVLASASDGPTTVALRELRSTTTGASCLVTVETTSGLYAGETFACDASRSDEEITTDQVRVVVSGETATLRFRVSYR